CQATIHPRPARVAAAGELAWDVHLPLTRLGPASVDGTLNGTERTVSAIATGVWDGTAVWVPPVWFDGAVAVGVGGGCALGGLLSPFRVGLEARCQVVEGGLDLALSAASAWLPFFDRDGPWARAGADLSVEGETVTWMAGVYGAYGPETWWLLPIDTPKGFDDPVDPNTADGGGSGLRATRTEAAVAVPLGVGWVVRDGLVRLLTLGLVVRHPLWADDARFGDCEGCRAFTATGVDVGTSVALTIGLVGK
ncbi:MAG: hypothetical protein KC583_14555, partial [Myxococcales bacterium]|nr:hypothetical protein [Myxococcales bacterium]